MNHAFRKVLFFYILFPYFRPSTNPAVLNTPTPRNGPLSVANAALNRLYPVLSGQKEFERGGAYLSTAAMLYRDHLSALDVAYGKIVIASESFRHAMERRSQSSTRSQWKALESTFKEIDSLTIDPKVAAIYELSLSSKGIEIPYREIERSIDEITIATR